MATDKTERRRNFVPDPTAMRGTLETQEVGAGRNADLRNLTTSFETAEERNLRVLEESENMPTEESRQRVLDERAVLREQARQERIRAGLEPDPESDDTRLDPAAEHDVPIEEQTVPGTGASPEGEPEGDGDAAPAVTPEAQDADPTKFNPNDHSVPEVQEYLAEASEEETVRVLNLERDGKARKTILGDEA